MTSDQNPAFTADAVNRMLDLADQGLKDAPKARERWANLRPKLMAAWRASEQLLYGYARAQFRGGTADWADIDAAFDLALDKMLDEYLIMGVEAARATFDVSDWQDDVAGGNTVLGFQDWLRHKAEGELL